MAKPFDATLKDLVERYPRDWLDLLGIAPAGDVELIDADLSTITTQADKVFYIREPAPWIQHLELQAGRDLNLSRRVLKYNVLLHERHQVPVDSVVILLRPEADEPGLTGSVTYQAPRGRGRMSFEFEIMRLWEQPVDAFLTGGLGTLPLAPLAAVPRPELPAVIDRMEERVDREAAPGEAAVLWTSTYILMGLRYPIDVTTRLLEGVRAMKESVTYQAILAEGRAEGAVAELKKVLLLQGSKRFGPPDASVRQAIESMNTIEPLERLSERLLDVESWDELLAP